MPLNRIIRKVLPAALIGLCICPLPLREGRGVSGGHSTVWLLQGCNDEVTSYYAQLPAYFRFQPVTAAPKTLLPALNSPGEWCIITRTPTHYILTSATARSAKNGGQPLTDNFPLSQLDQYGSISWVAGLIVGTPFTPEIGTNVCLPIVFDLACPSCFNSGGIKRSLTISSDYRANCTRCHRSYDLQNGGNIVSGGTSSVEPMLYRYRYEYSNDTFVVHN